mgnify:CR=1 FL=1
MGDEAIIAITRQLQMTLRSGDFIGRFGGDEFIVVLPDLKSDTDAAHASRQIIEALRQCQGVTLTRRSLAHDLIHSGELVQLSDVATRYANPYWLVWPLRSNGTAKLQAFADWLATEVAAYLQAVEDTAGSPVAS